MKATTTSPRIYVACLASYNAGILHGKWLDLEDYADADDLREDISAMLKDSPEPHAEEYAIHDYEGFGSYRVSEYDELVNVVELAQLISEHGTIIADFLGHYMCDLSELAEKFDEAYCGCYTDEEEYARELLNDCYDIEEKMGNLACYFDYALFTRDLFMSDNFSLSDDDGCHVFYNI